MALDRGDGKLTLVTKIDGTNVPSWISSISLFIFLSSTLHTGGAPEI